MASLRVDVKSGQEAFEALVAALRPAARVHALAVENCSAASMRTLAAALRCNPSALSAMKDLDLSADVSPQFDGRWRLESSGAEELRLLLPALTNLRRLALRSKSPNLPSGRRVRDATTHFPSPWIQSLQSPPLFS
jgi:hypothetical protein